MTDRKNQILAATCTVIGRAGAHDLRVEDVAKEAGVSPALVYYYFDTRAELLGRAFEFADERSSNLSDEHLRRDVSARKRLCDYLIGEFDSTPEVQENWIIWSEMDATAVFDEELRAHVLNRTRNWSNIVAKLIGEGIDDGSIDTGVDRSDAGHRLTGMIDSIGERLMLGVFGLDDARRIALDGIERELGPQP